MTGKEDKMIKHPSYKDKIVILNVNVEDNPNSPEYRAGQIAIDATVDWYKKNNPEPAEGSKEKPKRLNYSDLACEEGLELLDELFGGYWRVEQYSDNVNDIGFNKLKTIDDKDDFCPYFNAQDGYCRTLGAQNPNWQLILAQPREIEWEGKKQWVYFMPDEFQEGGNHE